MGVIVKTIYEGHLYAVQYGNMGDNEMDRLFDEWNDMETVYNFMVENEKELQRETWERTNTPLLAAQKVTLEAEELENIIYELCENSEKGRTPDLDSLFRTKQCLRTSARPISGPGNASAPVRGLFPGKGMPPHRCGAHSPQKKKCRICNPAQRKFICIEVRRHSSMPL